MRPDCCWQAPSVVALEAAPVPEETGQEQVTARYMGGLVLQGDVYKASYNAHVGLLLQSMRHTTYIASR